MYMHAFLLAAAVFGSVDAQIVPAKRGASATLCSKVRSVATKARQQSAATAFCASYLHIPSTVVTSTTSTTTVQARASTVTMTVTSTTGDASVTTSTRTIYRGVSTVTSSTCEPKKVKRAQSTKVKPACLTTYNPGASLSSACSCLSIGTITQTTSVLGTTTTTPTTTSTTTKNVPNKSVSTITTETTLPVTTTTTNIPPESCNPTATASITDGGFEDVPNSALYVSDTTAGGWTLAGEAYFQPNANDVYQSHSGSQFVTLYCLPTESASVSQDLDDLAAADYQIQFFYAVPSVNVPSGYCTFDVSFGGESISSVTLNGGSGSSNTYTSRVASFHWSGGDGKLVFTLDCSALGKPGSYQASEIDVSVDDVSITTL